MVENLNKIMQSKSNQELIKIVHLERNSYEPIAIEIAERELSNRKIPQSEIENFLEAHTALEEKKAMEEEGQAKFGLRAINFIIDFFVWLLIAFVLTLPFNAHYETERLLGNLIMLISFVLYFFIMELKFQQTVGKMVTKTKVVTLENSRPEAKVLLLRSIFRLFFPFLPILYFFISHRWLHDMVSDTKVVKLNLGNE